MIKNLLKFSAIVGAYLCSCTVSSAQVEEVDYTVAVANNDIILASDLKKNIQRFKLQNNGISLPTDDIIAKNVLEHMIVESLVQQLAQSNGIVLSDSEIDSYIERYAGGPEHVQDLFAQLRRTGMSDDEIRTSIKNEIISNEIKRAQINSRVNISEQEVEQLAKVLQVQNAGRMGFHLATITVRLSPNATPAQDDTASRKIRAALAEINKGATFADVARRYSESPNALQGGDMGVLPAEELPQILAENIAYATDGDVIGPIKTEFGYMLVKLYQKEQLKPEPVEQVKVRHILLKTNIIFDDAKAQAKLNDFYNDILSGRVKFADIASKYSEDYVSAANGGLMDWINPEAFDANFKNEIQKLKTGEMSKPFKSSFGWHIALLEGRKVDTDSIEAYKVKAREIISRRNFRDESEHWEQELRDSSYVKIYGLK